MTLLGKAEITRGLKRLGELALQKNETIELVAVGGAVMVLAYNIRPMTHDVDVMILSPPEASAVRQLAKQVADELSWPEAWLNDGAKGYLVGLSDGQLFSHRQGL